MSTESSDVEAVDYRRRRLCPDGACIGLIGSDGRCSECGIEGAAGAAGLGPETFGGGCLAADEPIAIPQVAEAAEGGFASNRPLCPDGACIGVIGADGRCGECGRATSTTEG